MVFLTAGILTLSGSVGDASSRKAETGPRKDWRDANASVDSTHKFSGLASFYGDECGDKTASGQKFNQEAMTAAHLTLPFGTRLKVTHAGRSVVVTINDRGPYVKGRVLDLSTGAARVIGITENVGVGQVVAEVQ